MAHIHEKIDWCAGVYIVHKNKVLIRLHEKYNIWIHVGGHVELDEDPVTAAKRECMEEVGLEVSIYDGDGIVQPPYELKSIELIRPAHMNIHWVNETHQHIDLIYYATADTDKVVPENESDKWLWLSKEEVEQHPEMSDKTKLYALGALGALGEK